MTGRARPSDFVRDPKFHSAETPPFLDESGCYNFFSYSDVMEVLANREQAFSRRPPSLVGGHMTYGFMWTFEPFSVNGEEVRHDILRKTVEPWFRLRSVKTMTPKVEQITIDLINEVVSRGTGRVNAATDLSSRLSMRVICALTGIDVGHEGWMREKLNEFTSASYADLPSQFDLEAFFWKLVAKRLTDPGDELLDIIVAAWRQGSITDHELIGFIFGFVAAGTDTTGASLANALSYLAEFDCLDYTRSALNDDEAVRRIVEEIIRFGTPFPQETQHVLKDTHVGGVSIPAGSMVTIWFAAANRDEQVNGGEAQPHPNVFDPTRSPNRHLGFGWGVHHCLGANLARLETATLLREGLTRLPGLQMDASKPFVRNPGIVDMVTDAHFTFDQDEAEKIMQDATLVAH